MTDLHAHDVANEAAAERRYARALEARLTVRGQRSRHAPRGRSFDLPEGSFVGRVLLCREEAGLGGDRAFYIGDRHLETSDGGLRVFSWSAPVAALFFGSRGGHFFDSPVSVRRTYLHDRGRLVDLVDEPAVPASTDSFPRVTLSVPPAPRRPNLPAASAVVDSAREPSGHGAPSPQRVADLRSSSILISTLEKPRTREMSPVLATLQPDQYDHVTADASRPRLLDGGPGTGKSVIASHRAVYLTTEDARSRSGVPEGSVLLVGPTAGYVDHVRGVTSTLSPGDGRLRVLDLPNLLDAIAGLGPPSGGHASRPRDTSRQLLVLARSALPRLLKTEPRLRASSTLRASEVLYSALRGNRMGRSTITTDPTCIEHLQNLPPWMEAIKARELRPLVAGLGLLVEPQTSWGKIAHVIVDEAQDLTEAEWEVLRLLNVDGGWTIVGDLDQRRSPRSTDSWSALSRQLFRSAKALEHTRLPRTYRSTAAILNYANMLLPAESRGRTALRSQGAKPIVTRASKSRALDTTMSAAVELSASYPDGTVAVIGENPVEIRDHFINNGWNVSPSDRRELNRDGVTVLVLSPFAARGLEFDGVIVHEPSDLKERGGSHGQLYTSLTRANKQVRVIHSDPLPPELVAAGRAGLAVLQPSEPRDPAPSPAILKQPWKPGSSRRQPTEARVGPPRRGRCPECSEVIPLSGRSGTVSAHQSEGAHCPGTGLVALP